MTSIKPIHIFSHPRFFRVVVVVVVVVIVVILIAVEDTNDAWKNHLIHECTENKRKHPTATS